MLLIGDLYNMAADTATTESVVGDAVKEATDQVSIIGQYPEAYRLVHVQAGQYSSGGHIHGCLLQAGETSAQDTQEELREIKA